MGDHRADRRASRRSFSGTPRRPARHTILTPAREPAPPPATDSAPASTPVRGRRRAANPAAPARPLARLLPSVPVLVGATTLAIAALGALSSVEPPATSASAHGAAFTPVSVLSGSSAGSTSSLIAERGQEVSRNSSRDSSREALADVVDEDLAEEAEAQARQRNAALARFAEKAAAQAAKIARNVWVLPLTDYDVSAGFGASSYLWSNLHTGLDLSTSSGTAIRSVANGVVTDIGYDGSYGNKTVVTLDDGTEIWYCHQTSFLVGKGDAVRAGETIGTVGSTGNSTGPHLHIEVRPGGGDPVDPVEAFILHGLTV